MRILFKTNHIIVDQEMRVNQQDSSNEGHKSESEENLIPIYIELAKSNSNAIIENSIELENDIKFSDKVSKFIQEHQQWKKNKMAGRKQSKDLYRSDNLGK